MKPSIGRIVHYGIEGGAVEAAIITAVHSDNCVNLRVFYDADRPVQHVTSIIKSSGVTVEQPVEVGCWGWPPRVE